MKKNTRPILAGFFGGALAVTAFGISAQAQTSDKLPDFFGKVWHSSRTIENPNETRISIEEPNAKRTVVSRENRSILI